MIFPNRAVRRLSAIAVALIATTFLAAPAHAHDGRWAAGWSTSVVASMPDIFGEKNWSGGFDDQSLRQVVRVGRGGSTVRVRLSNVYGTDPLRLTGATIARTAAGAAVKPRSTVPVTFGRSRSTVVPAGRELVSDVVPFTVAALESLTVTFYFARPTGPVNFHPFALATSYRAVGDHRYDRTDAAYGETSQSWYVLSGVDVAGPARGRGGTVVTFGDSITDGSLSSPDTNNRYPDELAERFVAAGRPTAVANAGIGGNQVLTGTPGFGEKATARFERDALDRPGVRTVIVLEGINDIGMRGNTPTPVTAPELINGHRALIRAAHARGAKVIGATITPTKGCEYPGYYTAAGEATRDAVNQWIRTSHAYDGVADFDRALADPTDPDRMRADYNGGDWLHPNDAGMKAMAATVTLDAL
jgi:lysophospholipase L1-like esterase